MICLIGSADLRFAVSVCPSQCFIGGNIVIIVRYGDVSWRERYVSAFVSQLDVYCDDSVYRAITEFIRFKIKRNRIWRKQSAWFVCVWERTSLKRSRFFTFFFVCFCKPLDFIYLYDLITFIYNYRFYMFYI